MIKDKEDKQFCSITHELVKQRFIEESDFNIYRYDALFKELLLEVEYKILITAVSYTISRLEMNKYLDENGNDIVNLFAYFRKSVLNNVKKIINYPNVILFEDIISEDVIYE